MKVNYTKVLFYCLSIILLTGLTLQGSTVEKTSMNEAVIPSLVKSVRVPDTLSFLDVKVSLGNQQVRERLEKELLLSLWDRAQVILWMKRASKYFPHIELMLKQEGLPDDLKYVAVVESALRPHAGSSKGAVGFWQFLRSTGRRYGLQVDAAMDERRNLFKSTRAACRYFKSLYAMFKSWPLAIAAYNMGEEGLGTEIKLQQNQDYFSLYLPLETQRYLFKIIACSLIMKQPEKYGFILSDADLYPLFTFDRVNIDSPDDIPLTVIAGAAKVPFKVIKDMNPDIRGYYLEKGKKTVFIPKGASTGFKQRFSKLVNHWRETRGKLLYVVKYGDNPSAIAEKFNITLTTLLKWNNLTVNSFIHPGDRLIVCSD